jgi:fumarate hydratase class II
MAKTEERQELWGDETTKAVTNFPVSGEPIPAPVARWLGRIKAAAARVNAELGLLDADKAERIAAAGDRIAEGELDDQFPIDVFQTGSHVVEHERERGDREPRKRGRPPNDERQHGPSSNDVFLRRASRPSTRSRTTCSEAMDRLASSLETRRGSSVT